MVQNVFIYFKSQPKECESRFCALNWERLFWKIWGKLSDWAQRYNYGNCVREIVYDRESGALSPRLGNHSRGSREGGDDAGRDGYCNHPPTPKKKKNQMPFRVKSQISFKRDRREQAWAHGVTAEPQGGSYKQPYLDRATVRSKLALVTGDQVTVVQSLHGVWSSHHRWRGVGSLKDVLAQRLKTECEAEYWILKGTHHQKCRSYL